MQNKKPIISYWKNGNPCISLNSIKSKLTEINVINTKILSDEFIDFCVKNQDKIFLHYCITGLGQTIFEPNIPTVKWSFVQLKKLIDCGFPTKKILVIVNPIIPNENGLKAIELLLRLFSEFKVLRLRYMRFTLLQYRTTKDNNQVIMNPNILKRPVIHKMDNYLKKVDHFSSEYYKLLNRYKPIIHVDSGNEALIGNRELLPFNFRNEWINEDGKREKLIMYEKNNKFKPIVNIISEPKQCSNKCVLCPFKTVQ